MSGLKVLVVGGSIAGPATAYWLAKAGAWVTVIERFPSLRIGGQAVDIRTAGVSVMRKMTGMEALVRAKSAQEEGLGFVRDDGRPYGVIEATGNPDQQTLISEFEIFRGDLSRILYDLTHKHKNVEYIFNEQLASMQRSDREQGPIAVTFTNGTAASTYDLVVACDGATSRTRAMGLGCGVRTHVVPTNLWAAYFSIKQDLLNGGKCALGQSAVGGRFIAIGPDSEGHSRVVLQGVHPRDGTDATLEFRQAAAQGEQALKEYVANHFSGMGWLTPVVLKEMMHADDFYASEIVQVKLPSLSEGRFALVGDAGYATGPTGGGTSMALAGAYMLAGELSKHPGDIAAGLKGYDERMRPLLKEYQKIPPLIYTIMAPQTAWGIWVRNHIFALLAWSGLVNFAQRYLGAAFADTKAFPLPEYNWVE